MKFKILLILTAGLILTGCSRDEKNLFSDSADVRLQKALTNAEMSYVYAENGWEMLYFPNQESCGYNILVKFNENGSAIVAACNKLTTNDHYVEDANSTWTVKADYGPLLSFDTYNKVLHAWADPQTDGDGYLGDYEFLILNASTTSSRLKGKKHEAYTQMEPLPAGMSWVNYFEQVNSLRDQIIFGDEDVPMIINSGATTYDDYVLRDGILQYPDSVGGDYFPLIIRPNCVQLYEEGVNGAVHFILNDDKTRLVCTDAGHEDAYIQPSIVPAEFFSNSLNSKYNHWRFIDDGTSNDVKQAIQTINSKVQGNDAKVERLSLCQVKLNGTSMFALRVEYALGNRQYAGFITLDYTITDGTLVISGGKVDSSITPLLSRFNELPNVALARFTNIVCDTFELSSYNGSAFIISNLHMNSTTKAGKTIHIVLDNTTM